MEEEYEIIFLDDDKTTVLDRQIVKAGSSVTYNGKLPEKDSTNVAKYTFTGWTNEEKLESVNERLILIAKYSSETINATKEQNALLDASLANAENTNLNATIDAGNKLNEQQKALEKDFRSAEQIVNEVLENGQTEIGQEANKDNLDR